MKLERVLDPKDMYIYPWYISDITATSDIASIGGINVERIFMTIDHDFITMYYDVESVGKIGRTLTDRMLTDKAFFETVIKNIYAYADDLLSFCEQSSKRDLPNLSNQELLDIYDTYTQKLRILRIWGWVPVFMDGLTDSFLSDRLLEELRAHMSGAPEKAPAYYSTLTSSEKESEVQKEEKAHLDIARVIQEDSRKDEIAAAVLTGDAGTFEKKYPELYARLIEHIKKFGSLTYAYSGPAMSVSDVLTSLAADLKIDAGARIQAIEQHYKTIKAEKQQIIDEIKLTDQLKYEFEVSAELMYMKDWRKGAYQRSYLLMDPIIAELGKRMGCSVKEMKYLILDEVCDALQNNKADVYKKKGAARLVHCCYLAENGIVTVYEGDACKDIEETYLPKEKAKVADDVAELKGQTAYSGLARGAVKIVLTTADISKVNEGDILVSSSTNPDLLPAMKKAGAFVTDLGGITSHAAIVSREMKKPCVVGLKIATHVLKDGDMVEVDAAQGIVRILERV